MLGSKHIAPGQLAAYIDAELSPEDAKAVEAHLLDCPSCYAKAMQQSQAKQLLHNVTEPLGEQALPGKGASDTMRSLLDKRLWQESGQKADRRYPALFAVIAVVALIFAAVYGVQSLVTDVFARDRSAVNSRTATYVEDHLSFTNTYQTAN